MVSLFIVAMVLIWGIHLASSKTIIAFGILTTSFLLAQLVVMVASAFAADQCLLVVGEAFICALCAYVTTRNVGIGKIAPVQLDDKQEDKLSLVKAIPWGMVLPVVLLIYFCEIFIRLRSGAYLGAVEPGRQVITGSIAFVTFAALALVMVFSKQRTPEKSLVLAFAWLMLVYLLALLGMLVFDADNRYVTNRILVACAHCDEVFLWMLLIPAIKRSKCSAVSVFSLVVIFTLAIPWALSFDLYYLAGLDVFFATRDVLVYGVAFALVVATTGTVGFLLIYALRAPAGTVRDASLDMESQRVSEILSPYGLTVREFEVAQYLAQGHSARKIAEEMYLSEASIRAHTQHIYRKMAIHSRQEFLDCIHDAPKDEVMR